MFRNKNKISYGTFISKQNFFQKKQIFVIAILLVVFAFGGFLAAKNYLHKNKKVSAAQNSGSATILLPGWWLRQYFGTGVCESDNCKPDADPDQDKLTNAQEFLYHSDPTNAHTVKDKLNDGQLVAAGFDPSQPGHVPIDQIPTSEDALSDGLVFNQDVVKLYADLTRLDNVALPKVTDDDLTIVNSNTKDTINAYLKNVNDASLKYFSQSIVSSMSDAIQSGDSSQIAIIQKQSLEMVQALKAIPVPSDAVPLAKNYIAIFMTLPSVVAVPPSDKLEDTTSKEGNLWYDQTRAYMYLTQQSQIEQAKLQNKYSL